MWPSTFLQKRLKFFFFPFCFCPWVCCAWYEVAKQSEWNLVLFSLSFKRQTSDACSYAVLKGLWVFLWDSLLDAFLINIPRFCPLPFCGCGVVRRAGCSRWAESQQTRVERIFTPSPLIGFPPRALVPHPALDCDRLSSPVTLDSHHRPCWVALPSRELEAWKKWQTISI